MGSWTHQPLYCTCQNLLLIQFCVFVDVFIKFTNALWCIMSYLCPCKGITVGKRLKCYLLLIGNRSRNFRQKKHNFHSCLLSVLKTLEQLPQMESFYCFLYAFFWMKVNINIQNTILKTEQKRSCCMYTERTGITEFTSLQVLLCDKIRHSYEGNTFGVEHVYIFSSGPQ